MNLCVQNFIVLFLSFLAILLLFCLCSCHLGILSLYLILFNLTHSNPLNQVDHRVKVSVKENEVPTEKNSSRTSIFAKKESYISN